MTDPPFEGRAIPATGFEDDDGSAPASLIAALTEFSAGEGSVWAVLRALASGRVLVPVVALLEEAATGVDGHTMDKQSSMATVTMESRDGRRTMLAFTSVAALVAWRPDARPVPVTGISAAQSALADGAEALLIDSAGPIPFAIAGAELLALAEARLAKGGSADDRAVRVAIAAIVQSEPGLLDVRRFPDPAGVPRHQRPELLLVVDPKLSSEAYRSLVERVTSRLRLDATLADRFPEGLRLRVVAPGAEMGDTPSLIR